MNQHLVVVGGGMVAQRLVEALRDRDAAGTWRITVLAEEPRRPYDRVALTSYFSGRDADDLALGDPELWDDPLVTLVRDDAVTHIDRDAKTVTTARGRTVRLRPPGPGDGLVGLGAADRGRGPAGRVRVPHGRRRRGAARLRREAAPRTAWSRAPSLGGGLLGLEAAGALQALGREDHRPAGRHAPHVRAGRPRRRRGAAPAHQPARRRRPAQRDDHADPRRTGRGGVGRLDLADGGRRRRGRRRDRRGRPAARRAGPRRPAWRSASAAAIVVDDTCLTSDLDISAVGEVACIQGAASASSPRATRWRRSPPTGCSAAPRRSPAPTPRPSSSSRRRRRQLRRRVRRDAGRARDRLGRPGGRRLQEARACPTTRAPCSAASSSATPARTRACARCSAASCRGDPAAFLLPEGGGGARRARAARRRRRVLVQQRLGRHRSAARSPTHGCTDLGARQGVHQGRHQLRLVPARWSRSWSPPSWPTQGIEVSTALCEHFALSRAQLYDAVRVSGLVVVHAGHRAVRHAADGRGCDICRPDGRVDPGDDVARRTSSRASAATLQDTNDHVMANLQKDGSYSVVPRIAGGEVTPEGLIAIGEVAKDFGLYTKITGGQRIDMFGARIDQLPLIWQRLVDAGFESGHAYGKSLRTVKSCVGSTWCRFGVQDSVGARGRCSSCATAACARRTRSSSASRAAPGSARRPAARTSASSRPTRAGTSTSAATAASRRGTRSCSPRTWTPRRWSAPSTGSSCTTCAPPTGCSARRRGSRTSRAVSTASARSSWRTRSGIAADLDAADGAARRRVRGRVARDAGGPGEAAPVRVLRQRARHAGPVARVRAGARPVPARHGRRARGASSAPARTRARRRDRLEVRS